MSRNTGICGRYDSVGIREISEQDEEVLYRIENDVRYDQICFNDAMLIGYPSITHYSSVMPYPVSSLLQKRDSALVREVCLFCINAMKQTPRQPEKAELKYLIRKELPENMQGWVLKQDSPYYVLENSNYQPVIRFESEEVGSAEIQRAEKTAFTVVLKNEQKDSQKLLLMIPWHSGWQLQLDGESIAPDRYQECNDGSFHTQRSACTYDGVSSDITERRNFRQFCSCADPGICPDTFSVVQ